VGPGEVSPIGAVAIAGDEVSVGPERRRVWRGGLSAVRMLPLARVARPRSRVNASREMDHHRALGETARW